MHGFFQLSHVRQRPITAFPEEGNQGYHGRTAKRHD
jgi:hypothetical protein